MHNTMLEGQGYCQVLLLLVLTGFGSVHGPVLGHKPDLKRGCLGDSIAILENIAFNSTGTQVSVYKTSAKHMQVVWHIQNGNIRRTDGHNEKLVLDEAGSVWIHRLNISDEANYTIQVGLGQSSNKYDITLEVIAPPTQNCKPNIKYDGTNIIADPNSDECGIPPASVKWVQHSGTAISKYKIQPGNNTGVYIACIDGDSLSCAKMKTGMEFCSFYNKTTDNSPCKSCETSTSTTETDNVQRAIGILTFLVVLTGLVHQIVAMKKISNQSYAHLVNRETQTEEKDVDNMSCKDAHLVNRENQTEEKDVDNMSCKGVAQPLLPVYEASCTTGSHDAHLHYDMGHQSASQPPIQELSRIDRARIKKKDKCLAPREHDLEMEGLWKAGQLGDDF